MIFNTHVSNIGHVASCGLQWRGNLPLLLLEQGIWLPLSSFHRKNFAYVWYRYSMDQVYGLSYRCFNPHPLLCTPHPSEKKQEDDKDENAASHQHQHACSSHPQEHVPACAYHAVCTKGHRARDHLLGLWQHTARYLIAAHEHPE